MRGSILVVLVGCAGGGDPAKKADPCEGSLAEGEVELLATGFESSEGLAFSPDGRLFVTAGDVIAEIQPDGSWDVVIDWEGGVGLAWWGDRLMAAGRDGSVGLVGAIDVDAGTAEIFATDLPSSNFLTVTPWGTLLVSDDTERIWDVTAAGVATPWLDVPGPNGMTFTADGTELWVVNTWDQPAPAWSVAIDGQAAGEVTELWAWPAGNFPDGVARGASGDLYTSLNVTGRISRLTADGEERTVAEGVDWTASIAFGNHDRWDRCSVYSTSLFGPDVYRVGVGEPGLPVPTGG